MPQINLNEREFELINIIGAQISSNQRDLSRRLDLSLGMTNMLIKRLISKGYIRIRQLNRRKMEYILTPEGFAEKMRKSMKYTMKTIQSISLIKDRLKEVFLEFYALGERDFYILGKSDFATLIELVLKEIHINDVRVTYIDDVTESLPEGILFICKEGYETAQLNERHVNLISVLAQDTAFCDHQRDLPIN